VKECGERVCSSREVCDCGVIGGAIVNGVVDCRCHSQRGRGSVSGMISGEYSDMLETHLLSPSPSGGPI
jgi:hypothetical protein